MQPPVCCINKYRGFYRGFRQVKHEPLTQEQKQQALDQIHRRVSDTSVTCGQCHDKNATLIRFEKTGYPQKRISRLYSDEVISLIPHDKNFVMPCMFERW